MFYTSFCNSFSSQWIVCLHIWIEHIADVMIKLLSKATVMTPAVNSRSRPVQYFNNMDSEWNAPQYISRRHETWGNGWHIRGPFSQRDFDSRKADKNLMKFNKEKCRVLQPKERAVPGTGHAMGNPAEKQLCRRWYRASDRHQGEHESVTCPCF